MTLQEALTIIKTSMENTATAAVKVLRTSVFKVDIGEKKVEVSNFPKTQQVAGKVEVTNTSPLESQLKAVVEWLRKVENRLQTLKPYEQVKVANFPTYPRFPDFPKEIAVSKPVEVSEKSLSAVVEAVKRLTELISKLPTKYPEVKIPPFPKVEIPPFPEIPRPPKTVSVDNLEKIVSTDPKKYVPVRLSDGEKFYKALEELSVAAGRSYAYSDSQGAKQQALVDSDRHVQVDVVEMPSIAVDLEASDIQIGAVEIKDGSSDTRAKVGTNGLEVEVKASTLPTGAATSAKQDSIITELQRLDRFAVNHIDEVSATVTYYGKEDASGNWLIQKASVSGTVTTYTFATQTNNPTVTTYADAWAARTTLVYGTYSQAF